MRTVQLLLTVGLLTSTAAFSQTAPKVIQAECHTGADDIKCAVILDQANDRDDPVKFVRQDGSAVTYTMQLGMKALNISDRKQGKIVSIEFRGSSTAITTTAQNITDERLVQAKAMAARANSKATK